MERKEAIEVIRSFLNSHHSDIFSESLETLIPELKESEDEQIRKEILEYFRQFDNEELRGVDISDWISWLEKQGKQKSVWSEEDEAILKAIIQDIQERHPDAMWGIDTSKTATVSTEFIIKFLKSLKPQNKWKPTEEQMNALNMAYKDRTVQTETLKSLYNDLKKL